MKKIQEITGLKPTEVGRLIQQHEAKGLKVAVKIQDNKAWIVEYCQR